MEAKDAKETALYNDSYRGYDAKADAKSVSRSNEDVMEVISDYCNSSEFEDVFDKFAETHYETFLPYVNLPTSEEVNQDQDDSGSDERPRVHLEDHPLVFHDVYRQFIAKFERMIEDRVNQCGYSREEFVKRCDECLQEGGYNAFFVRLMLSLSEYDSFFSLMRNTTREISDRREGSRSRSSGRAPPPMPEFK